jgi:hypothetical protein
VVFFFRVQWVQLLWEVIIRFVDIGGICHHDCFNFLFIMYTLRNKIEILSEIKIYLNRLVNVCDQMAITIPDWPCKFSVFKFPFPELWCPLRFPSINDVLFLFNFIRLIGKFMLDLCYLYLFTYTDVQTGLPYHVLFVSFNSNLIGATSKADTDYPTWAYGFTPAI